MPPTMAHAQQAGHPAHRRRIRAKRSDATRLSRAARHPISALDYWRRAKRGPPRLLAVTVKPRETGPGFTLVLANGRRGDSAEGDRRFRKECGHYSGMIPVSHRGQPQTEIWLPRNPVLQLSLPRFLMRPAGGNVTEQSFCLF